MSSPASSAPLHLPILVTFPNAPSWLVSRYVVSAGYKIGGQQLSGGTETLDHNGGVFQGKVTSNEQGAFPADVVVQYTVEYTSESGLPNVNETVTLPVTSTGARLNVQLPNRRLSESQIIFDFPHGVLEGDFLTVRWSYVVGANTITSRAQFLDYNSLLPGLPHPARPVIIGFVMDPAPAAAEKLHLEIAGRYFKKDLAEFKSDLSLPRPLILAQIKDDPSGGGFHTELR
jgi:hypothetical protein